MQAAGSKIAADNATIEIVNGVARQKDGGTTYLKFAAALKELIVKGWIHLNAIGAAIDDSYNVSAILDVGVGHFRVSWDIDFAINSGYACPMGRNIVVGSEKGNQSVESYANGSTDLRTTDSGGAAIDCLDVSAIAIGDQ